MLLAVVEAKFKLANARYCTLRVHWLCWFNMAMDNLHKVHSFAELGATLPTTGCVEKLSATITGCGMGCFGIFQCLILLLDYSRPHTM